tara:strand:- start:672 stop:1139 length:468 start_codon:yes stop_codon:yes gene_type:complete
MDNEQIKEFCEKAFKVSETKGIQSGLSYLIGEKFSNNFLQLKKARKKLQFLYQTEGTPESHPLNKGGRTLKMSYAMAIQEHYSIPLEQVKHYELFLKEFVVAIKDTFSEEDIQSYFESSLQLIPQDEGSSGLVFSDVLQEAEEILATEEIKRMFL